MIKILGWIGLLLFLSTLIPFVMRRLRPRRAAASFFFRHHHSLALACFGVLTLHGLWALLGRRGWGWGARGDTISGVIAWLAVLAAVALASVAARRSPFPRAHCRVAALLFFLVLIHVL